MTTLLRQVLMGTTALLAAAMMTTLATVPAQAEEVRRAVPADAPSAPVQPPAGEAVKLPPKVSQQELARFLAGLPPSEPYLAALATSPEWKALANDMARGFGSLDMRALTRVRAFSAAQLKGVGEKGVFYPFSGPDFTYVSAMFPQATTYVLCGLEPVGAIPDIHKLQAGQLGSALRGLDHSFKTLFDAGYFVTKDMRVDFQTNPLAGTLPVLYVMLVRTGNQVLTAELMPQGAKVTFSPFGSKQTKTLYYYSYDLSNGGLKNGLGPIKVAKAAGADVVYVKAASYLMHTEGFSGIRDAIMREFHAVLQDDSGIPVRYFDSKKWATRFYGNYAPPLSIFKENYQSDLADIYQRGGAFAPLDFGVGYAFNYRTANLMLAVKK